MAINLKELSARLGLSPTTVSRALSGYGDVSPSTRERVREAAQAFGYQPNRAARQVALGRSDAVGMVQIAGDEVLGGACFAELIGGIACELDPVHGDLLLVMADRDHELQVYERVVHGRRVDALLVPQTRRQDPRVDYLLKADFPFVAYGRTDVAMGYPWVDVDGELASRLAVERLVSLGHRRIACLHGALSLHGAHLRHAGWLAAMARAGLDTPASALAEGSHAQVSGYAAGRRWLDAEARPTAVVVDHVAGAQGLLRAALDLGLVIGRDLSIVVHEGPPADALPGMPRLDAVCQPSPRDTGRSLGQMLRALAERRPLERMQILVRPSWFDGESVGPPAA